MSGFKVFDKVRYIGPNVDGVKKGDIFTVFQGSRYGHAFCANEFGLVAQIPDEQLELVEETPKEEQELNDPLYTDFMSHSKANAKYGRDYSKWPNEGKFRHTNGVWEYAFAIEKKTVRVPVLMGFNGPVVVNPDSATHYQVYETENGAMVEGSFRLEAA